MCLYRGSLGLTEESHVYLNELCDACYSFFFRDLSYAGRRLFTNKCILGEPGDWIGRDEIGILGDGIFSGQVIERFSARIGGAPGYLLVLSSPGRRKLAAKNLHFIPSNEDRCERFQDLSFKKVSVKAIYVTHYI